MAATLDQLKNVLAGVLETRGALESVRARLRAEVYHAIEAHDVPAPVASPDTRFLNQLIEEYLRFHGYKHSASVFQAEAGTAGQRKFNRADAIGELGLEDDVPRVPDTLRDVVAISPPLPVLHLASSTLMQRKEVLSGAPVTAGRSERAIHCAGCQCGGPTVPSLGPAPPESQPGRYASLAIAHGASRRAGAQRHGTISMKKHEHHSADLSCSTDGQSQAAATSDDDSDNTDDERSYAQRLVAEAAGPLSDLSSEASYHGDDSFEPAGVMFGEA